MSGGAPTQPQEGRNRLEEILREVDNLPSAPKVLPRLKRLLQDTNSSMQEIGNLIRLDTALAARVLRASNSAYLNQGLPCTTVDEAVNRVGYDLIYQLVSFAVASQVLVRPLDFYGIEANEIWRQSLACALAAERIALIAGEDGDVAYTVGLMHRIGMVAINEWAIHRRVLQRLTGEDFPGEFVRSERAALGVTHADVAAELLRRWEFPPEMISPVQHQYLPRNAGDRAQMASLLCAARWVRAAGCKEPGHTKPPELGLFVSLRISEAQLVAVARDVRAHLQTLNTLLGEPEGTSFRSMFGPGGQGVTGLASGPSSSSPAGVRDRMDYRSIEDNRRRL